MSIVLGIESSCDETGIGIVRGTELLANAVASSMDQHAIFGGVIPEIAARAHVEAMRPTLQLALDTAGLTLDDIDAIAVTAGPGLNGALMVGVAAAKALALATGKPLYGINHLVAHVGAALLDDGASETQLPENLGALLVSGGHTEILRVGSLTSDVELLGSTIDDAAGEAYDKVARMLGLGYPGGPIIDKLAAEGNPKAIRYPRGLTLPKFVGTAEEPGRHRHDSPSPASRRRWPAASSTSSGPGSPCPWQMSARASRRPSWTSSRPRRSAPARSTASSTCSSAGA